MKSTAMRGTVRKMGNAAGVIIPEPLLAEIGAKAGDDVDMVVETGRLIIAPSRANPRAGWADDARRLAEVGDDALVWPEFDNNETKAGQSADGNTEARPAKPTGTIEDFFGCLAEPGTPRLSIEEICSMGWPSSKI